MSRSGAFARSDEDRLPWLETVEPDEPDGAPVGRVVLLVLLGLVVLGAVLFGLYHYQRGTGGEGALIAAPTGDYKIRPDEPGGLKVEGEGDSAIAASAGSNGPSRGRTSRRPRRRPEAGARPR
jgi:hypothetical protein